MVTICRAEMMLIIVMQYKKTTPQLYQTRMIINISFLTGTPPTESHFIEVSQFKNISLHGDTHIKYTGIIRNYAGGSK